MPRRLSPAQSTGRSRTSPTFRGHPKGAENQQYAEIPYAGTETRRRVRKRRRAEGHPHAGALLHHRYAAHGTLYRIQQPHLPNLSPLCRTGGHCRVLHR